MPCFAMICSYSMLLPCSKHCFLMLNSWHAVISTKSETSKSFAVLPCFFEPVNGGIRRSSVFIFCQASLVDPLHVFCCHVWCCSIIILMHLDGYLLIITGRCHICFACHFQTVYPILVIFILISTEITSPLQIMPMHHISHPAYHAIFMCWLFTMLCASFRCCFFGLVPITSCF